MFLDKIIILVFYVGIYMWNADIVVFFFILECFFFSIKTGFIIFFVIASSTSNY